MKVCYPGGLASTDDGVEGPARADLLSTTPSERVQHEEARCRPGNRLRRHGPAGRSGTRLSNTNCHAISDSEPGDTWWDGHGDHHWMYRGQYPHDQHRRRGRRPRRRARGPIRLRPSRSPHRPSPGRTSVTVIVNDEQVAAGTLRVEATTAPAPATTAAPAAAGAGGGGGGAGQLPATGVGQCADHADRGGSSGRWSGLERRGAVSTPLAGRLLTDPLRGLILRSLCRASERERQKRVSAESVSWTSSPTRRRPGVTTSEPTPR